MLHNIYVNNFFQVSFFFAQQPIWWCYNSTTKNQLEHTIATKLWMEPKLKNPQLAFFVDCKSYHSAKISTQILGKSQEVQLGLVITQYVFLFQYQTHTRCRVTSCTSPFHCSIKCIQSPVAKQPINSSD
jgi:hypothetical protein